MIEFITNLDRTIIFFVQEFMHVPILDKVMIAITTLGNKGFIWIVMALFLTARKRTRLVGIAALAALLLTTIMGEGILKHLVCRPRPYMDYPEIQPLVEKLTSYSFPSGHTGSSFTASWVFGRYLKKQAAYFWILAAAMGFSRLYLFMHYPSDILAGAVLGILCAMIIVLVLEKIVGSQRIYTPEQETEA